MLDVYAEPHDPARPVVCLDERPCVLTGDPPGRAPLAMRPRDGERGGRDARCDHEYVRGGTCCCIAAFEPLAARRRVWVSPQRRRVEFAQCVRELVDGWYPEAECVRLVCDNLNTHDRASSYEAFDPAEASRLARKVEFVYTPKHGSSANVVECELSAMARECLGGRRIATIAELRRECEAWARDRNARGATVEWHFTTEDARTKLTKLYPSV